MRFAIAYSFRLKSDQARLAKRCTLSSRAVASLSQGWRANQKIAAAESGY
jgi:hypothetical protein